MPLANITGEPLVQVMGLDPLDIADWEGWEKHNGKINEKSIKNRKDLSCHLQSDIVSSHPVRAQEATAVLSATRAAPR